MTMFAGVPVGGSYSRGKIERDFLPIQTSWQGEESLSFYVAKGRRKAIAVIPSTIEAGRFDIVVEMWCTVNNDVKTRQHKRLKHLAADVMPVVEEAFNNSFAPEPVCTAIAAVG